MWRYLSGGFPDGWADLHWTPCPRCGESHFVTVSDIDPCQECTSQRAVQRRRYERRTRNTDGDRYDFDAIAERDNWRCHICGKRIDPALSRRHPQGATIDHLIPVADGGGGDDPHNVALAHSRCNIKRGTGGTAQLRLVG